MVWDFSHVATLAVGLVLAIALAARIYKKYVPGKKLGSSWGSRLDEKRNRWKVHLERNRKGIERQTRRAAESGDELESVWSDYQKGLRLLRKNPTDAALKKRTLMHGRHYSALSREDRAVALYDEAAVKNDIDAACAAAGRPHKA